MARRLKSYRMIFLQKDLPLPGFVLLGRYQHSAADPAIGPHQHWDEIEICFLERGEQTFRVGGLVHRMRGNDQFFTFPDEVHDTANLPEERGILYWLILKLKPAGNFLGLSATQAAWLQDELRRMPTRHFRGDPDCARILGEMKDLFVEGRDLPPKLRHYRQLALQALLLRYLTLTIRASREGVQGSASPLMQRLLHYIEGHLHQPVEVPRLAEVARLSPSRCKARFKKEIGVPPAEFWLRKKIERAIVLLKSRSVTAVAYDLGFSSSQYFATVFKRYTLINPSQFHVKSPRESYLPRA
jgi:AraC-like DNA-binding protein